MDTFSLKGKSILVTAGSTWVKIDTVRVITNIFKGKIGFTIAEIAAHMGADVTLLLGPSFDLSTYKPAANLNILRFKFFDELDTLMKSELEKRPYDAVVHSAAVSDFRLATEYDGKIKSDTDTLTLELVPTKKIVDYIKDILPHTFLIKFKLEVNVTEDRLKDIAFKSLQHSRADLIVANIYNPAFADHEAFLMDTTGESRKISGREHIAQSILKEIHDRT
ncbi:MAG: phosphopantothenoylcysteine decarboxylase [Candidatus Pacebacteria bacterium]|nr:phosphopantothenoylcysteine decarboxylase [Candidatus Paceibacterota bacterium]